MQAKSLEQLQKDQEQKTDNTGRVSFQPLTPEEAQAAHLTAIQLTQYRNTKTDNPPLPQKET